MIPGSQGLYSGGSTPGPYLVDYKITTGSGANLVIDYPVTALAGDFLVLCVGYKHSVSGSSSLSGWTNRSFNNGVSGTSGCHVLTRVSGGETSITYVNTTTCAIGVVLVIRGVNAAPIDGSIFDQGDTATFSNPMAFSHGYPTPIHNNALMLSVLFADRNTTMSRTTASGLANETNIFTNTAVGTGGTLGIQLGNAQTTTIAGFHGQLLFYAYNSGSSFGLTPA